jgi:lipase chaperone LimK
MTALALLPLLLTTQTPDQQKEILVQVVDERLEKAIDLQHATEGTCGGRRYRVVETVGMARLSVTVDGKLQSIENKDAAIVMRLRQSAPVTQIFCARTSFRIVLGDPSKPVGYAYGFLRL